MGKFPISDCKWVKRDQITETDFLEVAKQMNIKKPQEKIEQVKSAVKNWTEFAVKVKVEPKLRDSIKATLLV
jgi:serine/threonine-protein kinase HipA